MTAGAALTRRSLAGFTGRGYDRGRPVAVQIAWFAVSGLVVTRWWCPGRVRVALLRAFGARIGTGTNIRHGVRVHWPWKLTVGDHSWIGEGAHLLNLEPVVIGSDVCVSQDVLLCTGSHDRRSPTFEFDNAPVVVEDGAWVAVRATVLRGVTIGADAVVGAAALVTRDVPAGAVVLAPQPLPHGGV
ncbi:putative colanic acid biosynthesis acetyltransferase [Cellulomonas sp. KH9]|uniref:putative colanic acid biosynthesis acetyltransferase n=1 Tax=Cellulomonas sp. KH9 TaxID=1855324 RepID=UPI0008E2CB75|nr:putative colanic acid biosynthesis acetyltransferase [Cellulomonas sp. KH9]SFK20871.1 putative colanic acid biosynthesis acetyltransferase WcaF [Cellulomonas sp. KH9]